MDEHHVWKAAYNTHTFEFGLPLETRGAVLDGGPKAIRLRQAQPVNYVLVELGLSHSNRSNLMVLSRSVWLAQLIWFSPGNVARSQYLVLSLSTWLAPLP